MHLADSRTSEAKQNLLAVQKFDLQRISIDAHASLYVNASNQNSGNDKGSKFILVQKAT